MENTVRNALRAEPESIGTKAPKILFHPTPEAARRGPSRYPARPVNDATTHPRQSAAAPPLGITDSPPDAVPEQGVHFATAWDTHHAKAIRAACLGGLFNGASIATEALLLVIVVGFAIAYFGLGLAGVSSRDLTIAGLLALVVLLVVLVYRAATDRGRPGQPPEFSRVSDPSGDFRVRVVGKPKHLARLRAAPIDSTTGFEPAIFRITFAVEPKGRSGLKFAVLSVAGIAVIIFVEEFLTGTGKLGSTPLYLGLAVGRFSRPFIWPTYLRLAPGRLDVLQYAFLGIGRPRLRTYDLRTCRICLQTYGTLALFPPDAETGELLPAASGIWFEPEPMIFERTILRAALTSAPAAPLPDDALTG
jgi:hypothetical protein